MIDKAAAEAALDVLKRRKDFISFWNSLTEETQDKIFEEMAAEIKATLLDFAYEQYAKELS